jgi:hypothetical protein
MDSADVAVIAEEIRKPGPPAGQLQGEKAISEARVKFRISEILKGEKHLGETREVEVLYFGRQPEGTRFYMIASDPKKLAWSTPVVLTPRSEKYLKSLSQLPKEGAERLDFFQQHFEDPEQMLARDAYDEFAKAPYEAVKALRPKMKHDQLVEWIHDDKLPASHRRLYLTLLGVCGTEQDLPDLEKMIKSGTKESKLVLDALIACYLILRGPEGMGLIEEQFLNNPKAEYTDIWSTIQSLRVLGQISDRIPRERLVQGFRYMLNRPQLADLVIPDLARWEDWASMERLVTLFKESQTSSSFVRLPVLRYLMACPLPEAKVHLDELAKLDPDAMKRATIYMPAVKKGGEGKTDSKTATPTSGNSAPGDKPLAPGKT